MFNCKYQEERAQSKGAIFDLQRAVTRLTKKRKKTTLAERSVITTRGVGVCDMKSRAVVFS